MSLETINFARLSLADGDQLLDVGCGEGRHSITAYLLKKVSTIGLDLSLKDLSTAQQRYTDFHQPEQTDKNLCFISGRGQELPFADHQFDKVICSEVLEHIHDYHSVLNEIKRVLKPGGILGISVPRYFPEWVCWMLSAAYHEVEGGHVRIFNARKLQVSIEALGFQRYDKHHAHALHVPYWWLKCLFWQEANPDAENWIIRQYHRFLVWDLMKKPWITRLAERLLNPIIGKSVVMYFVHLETKH
jgi:SAM-dependent methyltransferase